MNKILLALSVASLAVGSLTGLISCSAEENKAATERGPVKVTTMEAHEVEVTGMRSYAGTIEESAGAAISFPVGGTMQQLYVNVGDRVAKGQLIAVLDASNLQSAYDIAKATLDNAQDAYNRMKMLHDANSLPEMQWVEVQNALRQAQSSVDIAAKTLGDAKLYAPRAGYVSEKITDAGMTVAPGMPVVKIVTIDPVKVSVSIPENEIAAIHTGDAAVVTVGALGSQQFTGKVDEKGVAANPLSRSYDVKITIPNPSSQLLPGMICDVVVDRQGTSMKAMVLPINSVLLDADNHYFVWLDIDGHAAKRVVETGGMCDEGIIITSGLSAGDKVIVEGQQKVSQGTAVEAK